MTTLPPFPEGIHLLQDWQNGTAEGRDRLAGLLTDTIAGRHDADFATPEPTDFIPVGGAINLATLTMMHQLFGQTSDIFYKAGPAAYVRTTLMTRRLLGMNKLYISWPVYAFTAEAIGQTTMYPDSFPPGSDPDRMLITRDNWQTAWTPDFNTGIPALIKDMTQVYTDLTGLDPILHLSAPYSLAADTFGQEPLLAALVHEPEFASQLLRHLADTVLRPWIEDFLTHFPNAWIELSDASGSPFFIGPRNCRDISIAAIRYLAKDMPWGHRVYDANYRGDYVTLAKPKVRRRARASTSPTPNADQVSLEALTQAKHSVCRDYVIRLHDDRVPVAHYRDAAIAQNVPLYCGVGSSQIDRNSVTDLPATTAALQDVIREQLDAIRDVAATIAARGYTNRRPPWPGAIYFEDVSSESSFTLIEAIIAVARAQGGCRLTDTLPALETATLVRAAGS